MIRSWVNEYPFYLVPPWWLDALDALGLLGGLYCIDRIEVIRCAIEFRLHMDKHSNRVDLNRRVTAEERK